MRTLRDSGHHNQDFIVSEADGNVCRDNIVVAEGNVLQAGTVLEGPQDAMVPYDAGPATGVLTDNTDATDADKAAVALTRGPCELIEGQLVFQSGASNQDKLDAYADLRALGVIVRPTLGSSTTDFGYPTATL